MRYERVSWLLPQNTLICIIHIRRRKTSPHVTLQPLEVLRCTRWRNPFSGDTVRLDPELCPKKGPADESARTKRGRCGGERREPRESPRGSGQDFRGWGYFHASQRTQISRIRKV